MDLRRNGTFNQKKSVSVAAAVLDFDTLGDTTADFTLFNLPRNAIVTAAFIVPIIESNAATTAVGTLGTTEGGSQLVSNANLKSASSGGTFGGRRFTGTGVTVYFRQTITGAATEGKFLAVVEYVEYDKNTGEYTH